MAIKALSEIDIAGKVVLIREDLNVPIKDGQVTSDARIRAAVPTLKYCVEQGAAKVLVMSHLGRPEEGKPIAEQPEVSMAPVATALASLTGLTVTLVDDYLGDVPETDTDLVLFENVRVNKGEKKNDETLARQLASLCDVFVMDAFGTAHRAQATTEGVARYARVSCAGPLLKAELDALGQALTAPASPVVAIVGGSKVSTKLEVLEALTGKVDQLIVGGGIANTFIAAMGHGVGKSLYEPELVETARTLLSKVSIPVPVDVVTGKSIDDDAVATIRPVDEVPDDEMILDIGPESAKVIGEILKGAATIIWNGPVGVFEFDQFAAGTEQLARGIAANTGFSIAGGGDTLAAIDKFGIGTDVSYISTGGEAFLEFVEGKTLPAVAALAARNEG